METHKKVAVFGASTYLGGFVVSELLGQGWHVHAVLKSGVKETYEYLHGLRKSGARLQIYEVDLLGAQGCPTSQKALDAALEGCSAVVHCAFRSFYDVVPPEHRETELVKKAVDTTRAAAAAAARCPSVKRVVMCSTIEAAIGTPRQDELLPHGHPHYTFTEEDNADLEKLREDGSAAAMRTAGMLLAERAKYEELSGKDVEACTLLLGHPLGPLLDDAHKTDSFLRDELLPLMTGKTARIPRGYVHLVHVTDAARAVRLLLECDSCEERYLCAAKTVEWADLCTALREILPEDLRDKVPHEMAEGEDPYKVRYHCGRLADMGFTFEHFLPKMLSDFVNSALSAGVICPPGGSRTAAASKAAAAAEQASPADLQAVAPQF